MSNLTLDRVKTISFAASTPKEAATLLTEAGFYVWQTSSDFMGYVVSFKDYIVCLFTDADTGEFVAYANGQLFDKDARKAFLESQQQNTSEVPANEQTQPSVGTVACAAETHPELTVFCPVCDYHSASAIMCDPEDPYYNVTCSHCGLDADRQTVFLSPSGVQPHQAQLSTEFVDKAGQ
jgi:hypothetical protein